MNLEKAKSILSTVGVKENSRDIQILKQMLLLSHIPTKPLIFREIMDYINEERKADNESPFSRGWISKCLNSLVDRHFVHKDSLGSPYKYSVTLETLSDGIHQACQEYISILEKQNSEIGRKLAHLRSVDPLSLARDLYRTLSGTEYISPGGIDGVVGVSNAIISGIIEPAQESDILRVFGHYYLVRSGIEIGPIQKQLVGASLRGVKTLILLSPPESQNNIVELIRSSITSYQKPLNLAIESGNLQIRLLPDKKRTYRGIILNDIRMILILSDKQKPDSGVFITPDSNTPLILAAIKTFDQLWTESHPLDFS
ncbi:MAG: hypothetical protein BAJATHORv1_70004 [Candidatus Thorarchaeota archaeon]|nr:MAG: hypothetical protein BAJATHORv1_70004 [Candidatus Thorarchaeota archaeon]